MRSTALATLLGGALFGVASGVGYLPELGWLVEIWLNMDSHQHFCRCYVYPSQMAGL